MIAAGFLLIYRDCIWYQSDFVFRNGKEAANLRHQASVGGNHLMSRAGCLTAESSERSVGKVLKSSAFKLFHAMRIVIQGHVEPGAGRCNQTIRVDGLKWQFLRQQRDKFTYARYPCRVYRDSLKDGSIPFFFALDSAFFGAALRIVAFFAAGFFAALFAATFFFINTPLSLMKQFPEILLGFGHFWNQFCRFDHLPVLPARAIRLRRRS